MQSRENGPIKILALAIMIAGAWLLQACGGSSSNYVAPSTLTPSGGVTLEAITISPSVPFITLAGTRQLYATGVYSDGSSVDISTQVTWSASSAPSTTDNITVSSKGVVTGVALGVANISASVGSVVGALSLLAVTNGYQSSTTGILTVPFGSSAVDAAYFPRSLNQVQGTYVVQEVNLDADKQSSFLPVASSLLATIPMPSGFVPNVTAASQAGQEVAVISYSSPEVLVIDASNLPSSDPASNTVIQTFKSPVTQSVTFNGIACMICAAVVNPANNQLVLSTAQGYYTMDFASGAFTLLPLTPAALPAPSITLSPLGSPPYLFAPTYGSGAPSPEMQIIDLNANTVTVDNMLGLSQPSVVVIDLSLNYAAVIDAGASDQALLDLQDPSPLTPVEVMLASNLGLCTGDSGEFNMAVAGVGGNSSSTKIPHTIFMGQTGTNCVGFEAFPIARGDASIFPGSLSYGFGQIPATPDGNPWLTSCDPSNPTTTAICDPNTTATFNSVVDKANYGILADANQNWIAKISLSNLNSVIGGNQGGYPFPSGTDVTSSLQPPTQGPADPVVFFPIPPSVVALSQVNINFGSIVAGASSAPSAINVTNTGENALNPLDVSQIVISGTNAGNFSETDTCGNNLLAPGAKCSIYVIFAPSSTGQSCALLSITDNGGASPQTVQLSGNTTAQGCPVATPSAASRAQALSKRSGGA